MKITSSILVILSVFFLAPESNAGNPRDPFQEHSGQVIIDWNTITLQTMHGPNYNPLTSARVHAMVHIAMHDALNNISPVYRTYVLTAPDKKAHPVVAVVTAAHAVLTMSFPERKPYLDSMLNVSLKGIAAGDGNERGIALGLKAANSIVVLRQNDGANQHPIGKITAKAGPGVYQAVAPTPFLYAPFWATMQPFSLAAVDQFRSPAHPALTSSRYAKDYNEVKRIGSRNSTERSADQTAFAKYWYELSEIGWNRITRIAASDKKLSLSSTARLFALVNMALVDAYTAGWDSKFHYNFWRPCTAIQAGDTDGNDNTANDPAWVSLMDNPPVQDYPSTHSALGNAAATVLKTILGDNTTFTMASPSADPATSARMYKRFSDAAAENAESRVMAGIHFRFSCEAGLSLGEKIGEWTVLTHLLPVKGMP